MKLVKLASKNKFQTVPCRKEWFSCEAWKKLLDLYLDKAFYFVCSMEEGIPIYSVLAAHEMYWNLKLMKLSATKI